MIRSVIAVLAGFGAYGVTCIALNFLQVKVLFPGLFKEDWTTEDARLHLLNLGLSFGYSFLSGFVCVSIAAGNPMQLALVLGGLQLVTGAIVQRQYWDTMPLWYHIPFLVLIVPFVLLGGYAGSL